MEFGLLGPLLVRRGGEVVKIGALKQRALLIHLLLRVGQTVPVDRLIDGVWGVDPPPQARVTLRSYVSHLRRLLEGPDGEAVIVTGGSGYGVQVAPETVDAVRFDRLVAAARAALKADDAEPALAHLDEALGLWRGAALADIADSEFARGDRMRLEELRLSAQEDRFDALLTLGRHGEAVAGLEAFTAAEPLRERAQGQLMVGLYRSGRAPDALAAFQRFRKTLVEDLGLEPSPQLQELVDKILNQSRELDLPPAPALRSLPVAASRHPSAALSASGLVGRTHELAELQTTLDRLSGGEGGLLLIAGEPGIGKTALLRELGRMGQAAGLRVHWGRCHETVGSPAFWPWIQVLRDVAAARTDEELRALTGGAAAPVTQLVDDIAARVGEQREVAGEDLEGARFQLYDAIATFLLRAGEAHPMVVLVDDLHWADAPSLETVAFVTPLLGSAPLLVAGSYRDVRADWPEELEATLATVVREPVTQHVGLAGLQPTAVAEFARGLTGEPVSEEEIELLHQRTGGNPFFVRQLARLLREADGGHGELVIPTGVRHVISRRLSLLPLEGRELLEVAAVIGTEFDLRPLAAAAGTTLDQAVDAVEHASAHGVVESAGRGGSSYRFVHALVRETIYDSLTPQRGARLHAEVAAALEQLPRMPAAELAKHFARAADVIDDDRPVVYLLAAADEALELFAYEQAETHLRQALDLATARGDPAVELGVRVRLLHLLISMHGWGAEMVDEIASPAPQLMRAAGLRPGVVPLWIGLLTTYISHGDHEIARELAEELLAQADAADDHAGRAASHCALAYIDLVLGRDASVALEHLTRADHSIRQAPPEHLRAAPHLGVQAGYMRGVALAHAGDTPAAVDAVRGAIALAEEVADPFSQGAAYTIAALIGLLVEDPAFTAEMSQAGLVLCDRHGFQFLRHILIASAGWARARLGENAAEQANRMREAVDTVGRMGHVDPRAKYLLFTAETYLLAGDRLAAAQCLEEARALSAETGEFLPPDRVRGVEQGLADLVER